MLILFSMTVLICFKFSDVIIAVFLVARIQWLKSFFWSGELTEGTCVGRCASVLAAFLFLSVRGALAVSR